LKEFLCNFFIKKSKKKKMKKKSVIYSFLLTTIIFVGCKKNDTTDSGLLNATKTTSIKIGEPVVFTMSKNASNNVTWNISPTTNTQINTDGNQASIKFGAMGKYIVTAIAGNIKISNTVSVTDSIYSVDSTIVQSKPTAIPATILPFSAGETINIIASKMDSGSLSTLILSASTTNSYGCLSNSLIQKYSTVSNSFNVDYSGVSVPGGCITGTAKAGGFINLGIGTNVNNTYSLNINFNGTTYKGTIVKTGNSFSINWPYSTGVTITPKSL
jgi:hypothetical protein